MAKAAIAGPVDPLDLSALRRAVLDVGEVALPVPWPSAAPARLAFIGALRGFDLSGGREDWARLVLAASEIVDGMIDAARREAASTWQRQMGEG